MCKILILFIGSMVFLSGTINADEQKAGVQKIVQKVCPVLGGRINPKLFYQYKGRKIYVCCQSCVDAVKKNPEKYLKKVKEQQKEITAAKNITQKNCPVMGGVIVPRLYYEYNKKIHACSKHCVDMIKKHPEKYLKKVQGQQGKTKSGKKITQKICPVDGKKVKQDQYYTYNKKIYVCCKDCIKIIKKNPEKYLKRVQEEKLLKKGESLKNKTLSGKF